MGKFQSGKQKLDRMYASASSMRLLYELIIDVKGVKPLDEVSYLVDLISGIITRKILKLKTVPGEFLLKDTLVISNRLEQSMYIIPKKCRSLETIMPYYERYSWGFIKGIIDKGSVIIDVGAHIGCYTIPIARMVGPSGFVVAIEPSPIIHLGTL
jgi:hypothetical protein